MSTTVAPLRSIEDVLALTKSGAVVVPQLALKKRQATAPGRICSHAGQVVTALRWALDTPGSEGALIKTSDGAFHQLDPEMAEAVDAVVPTHGRERALVAFVGKSPSETDAIRGQPLSGLDGEFFAKHYLAPLGLTREDVLVSNLLPVAGSMTPEASARFAGFAKAELRAWGPCIVVALGKAAREELGPAATYTLPHPAVVRRQGDTGELERKLRKLSAEIARVRAGAVRKVHIAKLADTNALDEKRIVYGVALDPYQFDSQADWVPAWECEATAHKWLEEHRVIGFMHETAAQAVPVESWLWPYPTSNDYRNAMQNLPHRAYEADFGGDKVHSGAWVIGTRIDDPEIWQAIVNGEIAAYSIGGFGTRTPVDADTALPEVTFIPQVAPADEPPTEDAPE